MDGGEIEGYRGIESSEGSTLEVNGGLIEGSEMGIFAGSSFTITGGTIIGAGNDAYGVYVTLGGNVEISDGQIKGGADKSVGFHEDQPGQPQGTITICGGMFSDKAGENRLAEDYVYFDNTDPETKTDYPFVANKLQLIDIPVGLTLT